MAGRVDRKIARCFALRRLMFDERYSPGLRIDSKSRDAVVPAIRHIDKLARRMDFNFGG